MTELSSPHRVVNFAHKFPASWCCLSIRSVNRGERESLPAALQSLLLLLQVQPCHAVSAADLAVRSAWGSAHCSDSTLLYSAQTLLTAIATVSTYYRLHYVGVEQTQINCSHALSAADERALRFGQVTSCLVGWRSASLLNASDSCHF